MTQILCCLILHSPCSFWFVRFIFLCGGREGMQMVMHFPCLPSFLFLVHVGVSLLYGLAFHWIVYAFVFVSVFCMESIMWVRKRDGLNILLDKKGSAVGQQFSRLKNSFSEDSKHVKSNSDSTNSSSTSCLDVSSLVTTPFNDSPASSSSSFIKSPWISSLEGSADLSSPAATAEETNSSDELICSLVRKEGHVYSMAVSGDLLYTGSDSKNIRVWNKHKEFSGFKSNGGLVKAIVIAGQKIFTGHRDGKIRVWKSWTKNSTGYHKRVGTLPTFKDNLKNIIKPISYFDVRECRRGFSLRHMDAISCLCFNEDKTLLYSASWDKTFKVWRVSDWRCLETIRAHEDTVNSIVAGCDGLVFTGSADGTVKVWRRGMEDKGTKHLLFQTLLKQDSAITALGVNHDATFVYCGSSDGLVNFWEYDGNLTHRGALRGHKLAVLCLATAGNLVITGSGDKSISVWKRCGSQHFLLTTLTGHSGPIKCFAIEKDQEESTTSYGENQWRLYSGSLDKSVKIWQLSEGTPQSQSPNKTISSYVKRASSSLSIRLALESGN